MPARLWIAALALSALVGCASDEDREDQTEPYAWEDQTLTPEESAALAPSDGPGEGALRPEIRPGVGSDVPFGGRDRVDNDLFLYPEGSGKTMPGDRGGAPE